MSKKEVLEKIVAALGASLEVLQKAARASHEEATHESSRAENKYDTRGLEAAYLAGGQAQQAKELIKSIELYESLSLKEFGADEPIDVGAVVDLQSDGARSTYFIGPRNGGLEIDLDGKEVTVVTPQSPLGQQLVGKLTASRWTAKVGGATVKYWVRSVW